MHDSLRIAFDLDETLGSPIIDGATLAGFNLREGAADLLQRLARRHRLILWTVSNRSYADKALGFGLAEYFMESYTWDELPNRWKDVRRIRADYLVDDSDYHQQVAKGHRLESRYIIVPAFGSLEDERDPLLWTRCIEDVLLSGGGTGDYGGGLGGRE